MQGGEVMHLGGMFAAHRQYPQTRRLQGINDGARIGIEFSERAFYAYFPYGCRANEHLAAFDERARTRFELGGLREGPQQQMGIEKNAQRMLLIALKEPQDGLWQWCIEIRRYFELTLEQAEVLPCNALSQRDESRHGLAGLRNDDFCARGDFLDDARQMGLGFVDIHRLGHRDYLVLSTK
jgi:hypothetical protein